MDWMKIGRRWIAVFGVGLCLAACGGGGGSGGTSSGGADDFGPAVALKLSPDLPSIVAVGSSTTLKVLAIDAKGAARDVTASSHVTVDVPALANTLVSGSELQVQFSLKRGGLNLHVEALGLSLDKPTWVTGGVLSTVNVQEVVMVISEGFSGLTANEDGSFSLLPLRHLLITARAAYDGGDADITDEVQITSSDQVAVSVNPVIAANGSVPWWVAHTLEPGKSTVELRWAGFKVTRVINVSKGFLLQAQHVGQGGVTENATGRLTAYFQMGSSGSSRQLAYVESAGQNQWTDAVQLPAPPSAFPNWGTPHSAESPNGYRATLVGDSLNLAWVNFIGPTGELRGPAVVSDGTNPANLLRIAVTPDGNAHVWLLDKLGVTRKVVTFSDGQVTTVGTMPLDFATVYVIPRVTVAPDGTVGIAWTDKSCNVHFAFDDLTNVASSAIGESGSARIADCNPTEFANVNTRFEIASGGGELGIVITYGTASNATTTEVIVGARSGLFTTTVVDRDSAVIAGRPQIGMTGSGELVAIWPTEARGIWGTHRDAGAPRPESPFLVEAPFFSMGTNAVEGVHPRGDGRFLLVWFGGPASTPLQLRNYSASAGLGERLIFPYQIGTGTTDTTLIATPFGVSAAWSFFPDLDFGEFDAMQAFLP